MIHTINHIGIGVKDIDQSYPFYRHYLNFSFKLNDNENAIWELEPMFNRQPRMRMRNVMNPHGGPGLELFQHIDTPPRERTTPPSWGDVGPLELGVWVQGLTKLRQSLADDGVNVLTDIEETKTLSGAIWRSVYLRSPDGMLLQLVEKAGTSGKRHRARGISHVGLGVSDLERAQAFYSDALGFDKIVYHNRYEPRQIEHIMPAPDAVQKILLARSTGSTSRLSGFDGGMVKLVHCQSVAAAQVFQGRRFGDVGLTEIGLEVDDVQESFRRLVRAGANPLVPPTEFDLGFGPRGTLACIADPDGNVIELVMLKSLFKLPPLLLDWLTVRPLRQLARWGLY